MRNIILFCATMLCVNSVFAAVEIKQSDSSQFQTINATNEQYFRFNYGTRPIHSVTFRDLIITAKGSDSTIHKIMWWGADYYVSTNCPTLLPVEKSCTVRVSFQPRMSGYVTGRTQINIDNDQVYIEMFGWGQ